MFNLQFSVKEYLEPRMLSYMQTRTVIFIPTNFTGTIKKDASTSHTELKAMLDRKTKSVASWTKDMGCCKRTVYRWMPGKKKKAHLPYPPCPVWAGWAWVAGRTLCAD